MRNIRITGVLIIAVLLLSCTNEPVLTLRGGTMGTFYTVRVCGAGTEEEKTEIRTRVEEALDRVNAVMNTYDPKSEISRFNEYRGTDSVPMSESFMLVTVVADSIYRLSDGAFDPTVSRLVELWGFGEREIPSVPGEERIRETLRHTGMDKIRILPDGLRKTDPELRLDYAAIAKGYGVDIVAEAVAELGYENVLVEIGGEVRALGGCNRRPWRIGIAVPEADNIANRDFSQRIGLRDMACATSGDYQQFYVFGGKRYSHLIDPQTGYPIEHELTSVSVVAESCMLADALATAAIVLGKHAGLDLIESMENTEAFFIYRDRKGGLQSLASSGWGKYRK